MTSGIAEAVAKVREAAGVIFDADSLVRSVGVELRSGRAGYAAVRNVNLVRPLSACARPENYQTEFSGIPIRFIESKYDPRALARVPHSGPPGRGGGSSIPERQQHSPLVCGLQIQNIDDDLRTGEIGRGNINVGTLGCFVERDTGAKALLSNNHVVAGENRGRVGLDRILQPGSSAFVPGMVVGTLSRFVPIKASPPNASIVDGTEYPSQVLKSTRCPPLRLSRLRGTLFSGYSRGGARINRAGVDIASRSVGETRVSFHSRDWRRRCSSRCPTRL
jgi:hypothetical protein